MKIKDAIATARALTPDAFGDEALFNWINQLEGQLASQVFLMAPAEVEQLHYTYPEDLETELLVVPPYDEVYTAYLKAKVDAANGEYNKYANSMAIYNAVYAAFVCWFCQLYDPVQGYISEEVLSDG